MPWGRYESSFTRHMKVQSIARETRANAIALHVAATLYSADMLTDGHVPEDVLPRLAVEVGLDDVTLSVTRDALVKAGLFDRTKVGYRVHDYLEYNPTAAEVKEARRKATERQRKKRGQGALPLGSLTGHAVTTPVTERVTDSVTEAVTDSVSHSVTSRAHADAPVPSPNPTTEPRATAADPESPTTEPSYAAPDREEQEEPAAADTEVEATRPARIAEVVQALPGADSTSVQQLEPLALQLPADTFEQIVAKISRRRNVDEPVGLLRKLLVDELNVRQRRLGAEIAERAAANGLVQTDSAIERIRRDEPERYVESMARVLDEPGLDAYLARYVPDEDQQIALRDLYADSRRAVTA